MDVSFCHRTESDVFLFLFKLAEVSCLDLKYLEGHCYDCTFNKVLRTDWLIFIVLGKIPFFKVVNDSTHRLFWLNPILISLFFRHNVKSSLFLPLSLHLTNDQ